MKSGDRNLLIGLIFAVGLALFFLRGIVALKFYIFLVLGIIPLFFLLRSLNFSFDESFVFSIIISVGVYALLVYFIGITGISFQFTTILVWMGLVILSSILYYFNIIKKKEKAL